MTKEYQQTVVPVFWIAGEDHDFDEVNHTYAFNSQEAQLHKIKYHTMTPPESNVSRFNPDQSQMIEVLNDYFRQLRETEHSKDIYQMCINIIKNILIGQICLKCYYMKYLRIMASYSLMHKITH